MVQELNDLISIVNALQNRVYSLDREVYRLELIKSKFHLCIKYLYLSGLTEKQIARKLNMDIYEVRRILIDMRVKMRKE